MIGRREYFELPELLDRRLIGKIDSGAHTTSLHATQISHFEKDGEDWVSFLSVGNQRCEAPVARLKGVRSSNGQVSERIFIRTRLKTLDGKKRQTLVTLADRSKMACPMLIGRRYLRHFLIDCGEKFLLGD